MSVASITSKLLAQETLIPVPAEPFPIGKGRSTAPPQPSPSHKYEGVIDWAHYTPARRTQQSRVTTLSVGEMYWFMVSPIRREELAADRNAPKLTQEHGPFAHVRRHAKPKETEEGEKVKERDREGRVFEEDGEEYEGTADRKRKLQALVTQRDIDDNPDMEANDVWASSVLKLFFLYPPSPPTYSRTDLGTSPLQA